MNLERVEPWITEEYAKERNERIRKLKAEGKDPLTNKYGKGLTKETKLELNKQSIENGLRFNEDNLKKLEELGPENFIISMIDDLKRDIASLENPTPEESYKYTETYFNDLIRIHKESLVFYEDIYKNKESLKTTVESFKKRTEKHCNNLREKLNKINNLTSTDIERLDISEILELINGQELELETDRLLQDYCILPNSPATKFIKNISISKSNTKAKEIPRNKNVKIQETIDLEGGRGIYDYINAQDRYKVVIDDLKALISKKSISVRKTFNFILIKANQQNKPGVISFDLEEYQKMAGYKTKNSAYRGAIRNFETLRGISIGKSSTNHKKSNYIVSYIFTALNISYNQCYVECNPQIIETLCEYYTLSPTWAGKLNTKAYDLLDYIFYMARQGQNLKNIKSKKVFNISLKSINENIGGYDPSDTQRHTEYIINPILDAIEEIEETQKAAERSNIKITPIYNHDYKNAYGFLEGYLEIELDDEALNYYIDRREAQIKGVKKVNKKVALPTS